MERLTDGEIAYMKTLALNNEADRILDCMVYDALAELQEGRKEVERLKAQNQIADVAIDRMDKQIATLQKIITERNSNLSPNLEQENPYSKISLENGITRGDRIRAMADEELAIFLENYDKCVGCKFINCTDDDCNDGVLAWLRQPEGE